ncbi:ABC transporter permease [Mesorhizobium sp. M7A.F.Ca.US.006.04.2.1]|uniref:ABC transporter permease n=2 Tax=Mesorhizobium TaxID=68287 RepID=UPI000FCB086F|nr:MULTISPECIES: ABC transporter permease [unclassified Mesorhizobium]RUX78082.1 ABC transporter permease [Mesorhizobium sp. M7A.F.Ca.US.005.03.1.1]RUY27299.1 ABC transporter permease [Mesorhizobium sp. M7A.F.Ca.US.001.04.2.1]RUY35852.1 ABC transporter permease [Mesorhizobium sp. M7A.F.Ca.US.001.04.1.1]RVA05904.1 ABC transporter permease [Mesorhizobium sp. M7A.F.Ca.US.001.02.1.1]RVA11499.1 ABC transporter permease [Mesorhizobium sp. M7A.F.Ca.US.002.01.1.1]
MSPVARLLSLGRNFGFAVVLLVVLLAVNLILSPGRFQPGSWGALVGLAAPLIGAAIASTPVILAGRGGIDISVGPLMGFVNALTIQVLFLGTGISSPLVLVPAALLVGALVGAANGFLATIVRIQPIVATLGTYLILTGVTLTILPAPIGPAPAWLKALSGPLSMLPLAAMLVAWWLVRRTPYYDQLMAVGSDDRAAYTAGVDVTRVRFIAYVMTGILGGCAGLMLTALIGSADPNIGPTYTLIAIAAVALGGVSLAGGRGGVAGAAIGAIDIFLLQSVLTTFNVSTFVLQIAYGAILVLAVMLTALQERLAMGRR